MNFGKISQAYEDIERQSINEADDPHLVVSVLFKELLKSMTLFVDNIDLKEGGDLNVKIKAFCAVANDYLWPSIFSRFRERRANR